ncbi:MAG: hypothetical protein RL418_129 [Actinomycetota bacterium]
MLASAPFGWGFALTLSLVALVSVFIVATITSPLIVVDEVRLMAGRIAIPLDVLGKAIEISRDQVRLELGPNLDARAQKLVRGDLQQLVKIQVTDPLDPTPYIILSTRRAAELVSALGANRT